MIKMEITKYGFQKHTLQCINLLHYKQKVNMKKFKFNACVVYKFFIPSILFGNLDNKVTTYYNQLNYYNYNKRKRFYTICMKK